MYKIEKIDSKTRAYCYFEIHRANTLSLHYIFNENCDGLRGFKHQDSTQATIVYNTGQKTITTVMAECTVTIVKDGNILTNSNDFRDRCQYLISFS